MSVLAAVTSVFPPPTFMRLPALGVDVSDTSLKYVGFTPDLTSGQKLQLTTWGDISIPEGALQRGLVNDVAALGKVLKEMRERTGQDMVRLSLPEERAYVFETEISRSTSRKEIRGQLEFRLEENVPLSPRDAHFGYEILPDPVRHDKLRVLVTVYAKETINNYHEACQMAGVTPISFEVEAQAIARSAIGSDDPRTHMIVDFGKTRSGIGIVNQGAMLYTSTIDIGGRELSSAMRDTLGDVAESELTKLKNEVGLLPSRSHPEVRDALLPVVTSVVDDIETRLAYWNTRMQDSDERHIHSIILCGGSANMRGLPDHVTDVVGIATHRADIWQNITFPADYVPQIHRRFSYGYATAVGLALASYL